LPEADEVPIENTFSVNTWRAEICDRDAQTDEGAGLTSSRRATWGAEMDSALMALIIAGIAEDEDTDIATPSPTIAELI
jgi:hypothetical protein